MRFGLAIVIATGVLGCTGVASKDLFEGDDAARTWTQLERSTVTSGQVNWANASAPFRRYLLIQDGEFLCAVRFVNYVRGQDGHSGSTWSSGDETLTSAYEWNVLSRAGDKVRVTEQGRDTVSRTALRGIGRFVIAGGSENVHCGNRKFGWQYPAAINFSQAAGSRMQLAPTRWERVDEIQLNDPKLVWYSFDPKREQVRIRVGNL